MNQQPAQVPCPRCKQPVIWDKNSPYRPFCSKICQMIDFGDWADETHSIPSTPDQNDSENWSE